MEDRRASQRSHCEADESSEKVGVESPGHEGHHTNSNHAGQTEEMSSLLETDLSRECVEQPTHLIKVTIMTP